MILRFSESLKNSFPICTEDSTKYKLDFVKTTVLHSVVTFKV
jgi:hypothetical protein